MLRKIYAKNYVKVENFSCFRSKSKKTLKKHILVSFFLIRILEIFSPIYLKG